MKGWAWAMRFLGHVERCRVLLHLVDGTGEHAGKDYKTVRHDSKPWPRLTDSRRCVALSKADALSPRAQGAGRAPEARCKEDTAGLSAPRTPACEVLRGLVKVIDGDRATSGEPAEAEAWHP